MLSRSASERRNSAGVSTYSTTQGAPIPLATRRPARTNRGASGLELMQTSTRSRVGQTAEIALSAR